MKILITGSNGFIGSNLCKVLSKNHDVIALSRKFTSLAGLNVIKVNFELNDYSTLQNAFETYRPDLVIHCAWMGANSSKDVNELWQIENIDHGSFILELCKKYNVQNFMGIGSSSEFGNYKNKFNEKSTCKPHNMYGISKYAFKMISEFFCTQNNINYMWIRPVFTYGPYDIETRLIPKVINSCLKNSDLKLNSCNAVVDYLYIEDFCEGVERIIENKIYGDTIISSNQEIEIKSLVKIIIDKISPNLNVIFDYKLDDESPKYICGTSEKLLRTTQWKPKTSLADGLDKTIHYFKQRV